MNRKLNGKYGNEMLMNYKIVNELLDKRQICKKNITTLDKNNSNYKTRKKVYEQTMDAVNKQLDSLMEKMTENLLGRTNNKEDIAKILYSLTDYKDAKKHSENEKLYFSKQFERRIKRAFLPGMILMADERKKEKESSLNSNNMLESRLNEKDDYKTEQTEDVFQNNDEEEIDLLSLIGEDPDNEDRKTSYENNNQEKETEEDIDLLALLGLDSDEENKIEKHKGNEVRRNISVISNNNQTMINVNGKSITIEGTGGVIIDDDYIKVGNKKIDLKKWEELGQDGAVNDFVETITQNVTISGINNQTQTIKRIIGMDRENTMGFQEGMRAYEEGMRQYKQAMEEHKRQMENVKRQMKGFEIDD